MSIFTDPEYLSLISSATGGFQNSQNKTVSVAGSTLSGAAKGAQIGSFIPGAGTAVGAIVGGAAGFIGGKRNAKRQEQLQLAEKNQREQLFIDKSQAVLDLFPVEGNIGGGNIYKFGGKLRNSKLLLESYDITKIGDGYELMGRKHEEGGVPAITEDGQEIELELGEIIIDDKVYTDRLFPSDQVINIIFGKYRITPPEDADNFRTTYATLAKLILNKIEEINNYKYIGIRGSVNTNILMTNRYQRALEILFIDQENTKAVNNGQA